MNSLEEILRPPTQEEVQDTVQRYSAVIERAYGERLRGIYLFGSHARGDHGPDSDADVAVVLADGAWDFWDEKMRLVDLAYDVGFAVNLHLQPWPFSEREWSDPENSARAKLLRLAKRNARPLR